MGRFYRKKLKDPTMVEKVVLGPKSNVIVACLKVDAMVQLRSYFSLCGIVGGGPLGVVPDAGATPTALVTLSRNIIMRYRLSDQKQIGGWTSKDFITAPVVYDSNDKSYVGVFSENKIKVWDVNTESLDKIKKHKFQNTIFRLLTDKHGKTTIVFKDGSCASLAYGMLTKKNLEKASFLKEDETIVDAAIYHKDEDDYICLITEQENKTYNILTCSLNLEINTLAVETLQRKTLEREDISKRRIIGMAICRDADTPQVFIIWSDGRLYSYDLLEHSINAVGQVPWLSFDVNVNLVWIGDNHLGVYGADSAQEGAVLVVFNVLFGIGSCRYPLKMFFPGARVWSLPENILLEANQQLAVVPYSLSSHRNVLSLLGSNKKDCDLGEISNVDWGIGKVSWKPAEKWASEAEKGVSERDISCQFLLNLLAEDKITDIKNAIDEFTDIPESLIVSLVNYVMKKFKYKMDGIESDDFKSIFENNFELRQLLDTILNLPFVNSNIIPHLRISFDMQCMVIFLRYIDYLLNDNHSETQFSISFEQKILKWGSVLIDSHFQKLVILKNTKNLEVITRLKNTLDDLIEGVNCVESVLPLLHSICYENNDEDSNNVNDSSLYYIEEVKLF